jgi:hypothetical protein
VPAYAVVNWYNTSEATLSQWFSTDGVTWGTLKFPVTLPTTYPYYLKVKAYNPIWFPLLYEESGSTAYDSSGYHYAGVYSGAPTLSSVVGPDGGVEVPAFSGAQYVDFTSATGLLSAFNGDTGTFSVWIKASAAGIWTDGAAHNIAYFYRNASNFVLIHKTTTNNQLLCNYTGGGVTDTVTYNGAAGTDWMHLACRWDRTGLNQVQIFFNGAPGGIANTLGTFSGDLVNAYLGRNSTSANYWSGSLAFPALFDTALSNAVIADLATI